MRNKRGWIRILEATMAVLLVSGVMVVVYSKQVDKGIAPADYFYSLQRQILADISAQSDLRLAVLNTVVDDSSDGNFSVIDDFINNNVPSAFDYSLRICILGSSVDFCKMDSDNYKATLGKDVFVEELVVSSDLGVGGGTEVYDPKKLRFFIWEGGREYSVSETCFDNLKNQDETDVDCGGTCSRCGLGDSCLIDSDCVGSNCDADLLCISGAV